MLAAVITLSAMLIAVATFAVFAVRNARWESDIWKERWHDLQVRFDDKNTRHARLVSELEVEQLNAMDSLRREHRWAVDCAKAEREMYDDAIYLFMELHPDLADNFGAWSEDRHGQRDKLRGVDHEKVQDFREQEELSDRFSSYVKAKRDASGKVASDARDS